VDDGLVSQTLTVRMSLGRLQPRERAFYIGFTGRLPAPTSPGHATMQSLPSNVNPFALMLDPQAVFAKIECSERLERLHRRVCRPLDKPLLGGPGEEGADSADVSAEAAVDEPSGHAFGEIDGSRQAD
jgi:hypothetical protein